MTARPQRLCTKDMSMCPLHTCIPARRQMQRGPPAGWGAQRTLGQAKSLPGLHLGHTITGPPPRINASPGARGMLCSLATKVVTIPILDDGFASAGPCSRIARRYGLVVCSESAAALHCLRIAVTAVAEDVRDIRVGMMRVGASGSRGSCRSRCGRRCGWVGRNGGVFRLPAGEP